MSKRSEFTLIAGHLWCAIELPEDCWVKFNLLANKQCREEETLVLKTLFSLEISPFDLLDDQIVLVVKKISLFTMLRYRRCLYWNTAQK